MYGTYIGFAERGEMIPNENSYCEIDPDTVDQWGIPVLRFHWQWSENEIKMAKHMQETFRDHRGDGRHVYSNSNTFRRTPSVWDRGPAE